MLVDNVAFNMIIKFKYILNDNQIKNKYIWNYIMFMLITRKWYVKKNYNIQKCIIVNLMFSSWIYKENL